MKKSFLRHMSATLLLLGSLMLVPLAVPTALAQNTSTTTSTQSSPAQSTQSNTTRQTTSTTTTQPVQTTTTQTTSVDPLWIAAGVIGLLALLAIVLLAMRGRGRDRVTDVRETTTVIKKD